MQQAFTAYKIFTGTGWLQGKAVLCSDGKITEIIDVADLPKGIVCKHFEDSFLAPAFVDIQVYGAGGKLFSANPGSDALDALANNCLENGTIACLPTVATNTPDVIFKCIDEAGQYMCSGSSVIKGLHIEGPWINALKRGAHVEEFIKTPNLDEVKNLLEYGKGVIKVITLAPEICPIEIIELINSYGVKISAGHSNATFSQASEKFDKGINLATHLYNAMPPFGHRETGILGTIFNSNSVLSSIVPDGYHVDFTAVKIASKLMGERLFAITDAVTETSTGPYQHSLEGDKYVANGVLSGSALTMIKALDNLVNKAGIELSLALKMCSAIPAKAIEIDNKYGFIAKGYTANFAVIANNLKSASIVIS